MAMRSNAETGAWGEQQAVKYLRSEGFVIRHVNWRKGKYEIDVVAERGEYIHFIEVKCRGGRALKSPEEAFDNRKQQALMKAVNAYISEYEIDLESRIDLVAIDTHNDNGFELRYFEDVMPFTW